MFSRFLTNLITLLLAGFLAVACFAFGPGTVVWLAFGIGCAVTVVALADFAFPERGGVQRAVDVIGGALAAWLIVASLTYSSPTTVRWIAFGAAGLLVGLALVGLIAHEALVLRRRPSAHAHNGDGYPRSGFRAERAPSAIAAGRH